MHRPQNVLHVVKKSTREVKSIILVYHFLQHAKLFCSNWMRSCVHLKKRGLVNWDWYFGERMETSSVCEKDTQERTDKILFKNYVYTQQMDKQTDTKTVPID